MGLIQSYVKVIKWALINSFLVMTYENGTFYRIEESPEASPFELSSYKSMIMKAPAVSMGVIMLKTPDISKSLISKLLL